MVACAKAELEHTPIANAAAQTNDFIRNPPLLFWRSGHLSLPLPALSPTDGEAPERRQWLLAEVEF
jgi:hypothetical protein